MSTSSNDGGRKPGSQSALRRRNSALIVSTLARRGPTTQATLSRVTGLSTGTVSNLVKILEASRVVTASPTIASGRRALAISLTADGLLVAGVDVRRDSLRVVVCGTDQSVVAEGQARLEAGHGPAATIRRAKELIAEAAAEQGASPDRLVAAAISLPTRVQNNALLLSADPRLPNWEGVSIPKLAQDILGVPVQVDNDANLGALAQVTFGPFKDAAELTFVHLGQGVGAGMIVNRELLRGSIGTAGEIGHILVQPYGDKCWCGNRGCLETVVSTDKIGSRLNHASRGRDPIDPVAMVALARNRDPAALRLLASAGDAVGGALASLATVINPAAIVVGGPLAGVGAPLMDPVFRAFHRRTLPGVAGRTTLAANQLGARTEALGAAALAISHAPIPLS